MSYILYICTISLLSLTSLSFAILSSSSALADTSTVSSATVTVSETCAMTGTVNTLHTAELVNGTYSGLNYTNGIGQTTLKVFCNDGAGFAIYAIGYTNNEYGNNYMHWNKATTTSDHTNDIATGIYSSGASTSSWSMKLASVAGAYAATIDDGVSANNNSTDDFTNWHTIPTEYKRVAYRTSGTDVEISGQGTGSSITLTYDAFVSGTQPAGTYIGQVKYTMVHPNMSDNSNKPMTPLNPSTLNLTNAIIYAPNTSDTEGDMSSLGTTTALTNASPKAGKVSATANSTADLIAPNFYRPGYGFAGWSTDFTATSSSTIYGPNETISTNPSNGGLDVSGGAVLYPVWIASSGDLQGWSGCSSLTPASYNETTGALTATLSSITALTDTRDDNVYAVAKLADGQCWMIENLRLNNEDTISAEDIAKAQLYGNATTSINASGNNLGRFIGLPVSEDANFRDNTTANSLYSIDGSNGTININSNSSYYPGYRLPRYNNNNTNMATNATNSDGTTTLDNSYNANNNHVRWYSYGNYYNWPAAIANTEYYTTYSGTNGSDAAGTSLCPSGWHLPLGYTSTGALDDNEQSSTWRVGGFSYLDRKMGGTGQSMSNNSVTSTTMAPYWRKFPNNFVYSGYFSSAGALTRGSGGNYWSRSASNSYNAYYLNLYSSGVDPGTYDSVKYNGRAVRCVAGS